MINIPLITKPEQALQNIYIFQKEVQPRSDRQLNALLETLSQFRAWYAHKDGDKWIFGPSKFIGYNGLTLEKYATFYKEKMDGRKTEAALNAWFTQPTSKALIDELNEGLNEFLASFGKKPSALSRISILRENTLKPSEEKNSDSNLVDALLTIYQSLPEDLQDDFRRQLADF